MQKVRQIYLAQILERIDRIKECTTDGKQAFFNDSRTQDAVIRNFEVIDTETLQALIATCQKGHKTAHL